MNVADIHKKYDAQFKAMMRDLFADLNAVAGEESITELEVTFDVETLAKRSAGKVGVDSILLTDASLNVRVKYGG